MSFVRLIVMPTCRVQHEIYPTLFNLLVCFPLTKSGGEREREKEFCQKTKRLNIKTKVKLTEIPKRNIVIIVMRYIQFTVSFTFTCQKIVPTHRYYTRKYSQQSRVEREKKNYPHQFVNNSYILYEYSYLGHRLHICQSKFNLDTTHFASYTLSLSLPLCHK